MQFKILLLALLIAFIIFVPLGWLANNVDTLLSNFPEDGLHVSFQQGKMVAITIESPSQPILIAAH